MDVMKNNRLRKLRTPNSVQKSSNFDHMASTLDKQMKSNVNKVTTFT